MKSYNTRFYAEILKIILKKIGPLLNLDTVMAVSVRWQAVPYSGLLLCKCSVGLLSLGLL